MTTLEKINTLTWYDFIRKIKSVLTELNSKKIYPLYANNTAALAGGLIVDDTYKTSAGDVKVVV